MGTDHQRSVPVRGRSARRSPFGDGGSAQHKCHLNAEWGEESLRRCGVLTRQQLRWGEEGALMPSGRRRSGGNKGDRGLAGTDIALEQAQHR